MVSKRSKSVLGKKSGSVGVATISIYFQMFAATPSQKRNYFCTFSSLRMSQLWKSHTILVVAQFSNMIFRLWYLSTGRQPISTQGRPSLALFVNVSWCNLVTRYQTLSNYIQIIIIILTNMINYPFLSRQQRSKFCNNNETPHCW